MGSVGTVLLEYFNELVYGGAFGAFLEAEGDGVLEHEGVTFRDAVISTILDPFEELIHALTTEGRLEAAQLVHDAPKGPHITVEAVRLIVPDLRTGVIRSPGLSMRQAILQFTRYVKVPNLDLITLSEEDVGWFQVAVDDVHGVEVLQPCQHLCSQFPHLVLVEAFCILEPLLD